MSVLSEEEQKRIALEALMAPVRRGKIGGATVIDVIDRALRVGVVPPAPPALDPLRVERAKVLWMAGGRALYGRGDLETYVRNVPDVPEHLRVDAEYERLILFDPRLSLADLCAHADVDRSMYVHGTFEAAVPIGPRHAADEQGVTGFPFWFRCHDGARHRWSSASMVHDCLADEEALLTLRMGLTAALQCSELLTEFDGKDGYMLVCAGSVDAYDEDFTFGVRRHGSQLQLTRLSRELRSSKCRTPVRRR